MLNPPNSFQSPGSFEEAVERMTRRVRQDEVDAQLFEILQQVFEKELGRENVVLSRPDRVRLFRELIKTVMNDVLSKLDSRK
jgi:hypothetical protein